MTLHVNRTTRQRPHHIHLARWETLDRETGGNSDLFNIVGDTHKLSSLRNEPQEVGRRVRSETPNLQRHPVETRDFRLDEFRDSSRMEKFPRNLRKFRRFNRLGTPQRGRIAAANIRSMAPPAILLHGHGIQSRQRLSARITGKSVSRPGRFLVESGTSRRRCIRHDLGSVDVAHHRPGHQCRRSFLRNPGNDKAKGIVSAL